jgi:hypothetical protein
MTIALTTFILCDVAAIVERTRCVKSFLGCDFDSKA